MLRASGISAEYSSKSGVVPPVAIAPIAILPDAIGCMLFMIIAEQQQKNQVNSTAEYH